MKCFESANALVGADGRTAFRGRACPRATDDLRWPTLCRDLHEGRFVAARFPRLASGTLIALARGTSESKMNAMPLERVTCLLLCAGPLLGCSSGDAPTGGNDGRDSGRGGGWITLPVDVSGTVEAGAITVHGDGAVGEVECRRDVSLTA